MPGGWGDPCVPAHEPYFYLVCHLAETLGHTTGNQTPRTHMKPHSEPAPARARVVDLSCRITWGVAFRFSKYIQTTPHKPQGLPRDYRRLPPINATRTKKDPAGLAKRGKVGGGQGRKQPRPNGSKSYEAIR